MIDGHWLSVRDGDPRVVALYRRHYSSEGMRHHDHVRHGISGPGETMVLLTPDCMATFVWLRNRTERYDHQTGINCTIFRSESHVRSSDLIREACELAWQRWPGERLFTYIADAKIRSVNPGACFKFAGFRTCGRNADGRLTILEMLPEWLEV